MPNHPEAPVAERAPMPPETFHLLLRAESNITDEVRKQIEEDINAFVRARGGQKKDLDLFTFSESFNRFSIWWNQIKKIVGSSCRVILIRDKNPGCVCHPESMQLGSDERKNDFDTTLREARETMKSYL